MDFYSAFMVYFLFLVFLCGACAGSFINCAADRYALKESIFRGRSHCPSCGHTLGILDLFPILSYLFLRGRCRYCQAHIPIRCLVTEIFGGLFFLSAAARFGFSFQTLEACLLLAALFAVALIDLDTMEIPDGILVFCVLIFLLFLPAHSAPLTRLRDGALSALIFGGGFLILSLFMDFVLKRESLGGGDIKLFATLGLFFGGWKSLLLIILSCLVGLLFFLACCRHGDRRKEFPFGPSIAFAAWIVLLFGQNIINFYLSLILS